MTQSLESELAAVVGPAHVVTDPDLRATYETDWTGRFHGAARCVARPGATGEVAAVLRTCARHGAPVVVQGGNTGLVGGGVPAGGEVLLSTTRLRSIDGIDPVSGQLTVGAGATLAEVQAYVRPRGFDVGIDFAARESATIGGMTATNAGGERVIRHGGMRSQVVGLEAVLADGSVLTRLVGLPKDNTGYDLVGLLSGSEGTLAVVTRVRLRLIPLLTARAVAVLGLPGVGAALAALAAVKERLPDLEAAELFLADGLALVRDHLGLPAPMGTECAAYLLVEIAGRTDPTDRMLEAIGGIAEERDLAGVVLDAVIATDASTRHRLWQYREAHTESINAVGVPVKLDVAVPLARLEEALERLPGLVADVAPRARTIVFGHVNEGNMHVNVLAAGDRTEEVTDAVLRLVTSYGGSISAEHGVGRAKVAWLPLSRSEAEIEAMRAVKRALDPYGILNPGVILQAAISRT